MALLLICSICVSCEVLSIKTIYCKLVVNNVKWSFSGYKTHYFHYKNKKEFYENAQLHQLTWNREYFFLCKVFYIFSLSTSYDKWFDLSLGFCNFQAFQLACLSNKYASLRNWSTFEYQITIKGEIE